MRVGSIALHLSVTMRDNPRNRRALRLKHVTQAGLYLRAYQRDYRDEAYNDSGDSKSILNFVIDIVRDFFVRFPFAEHDNQNFADYTDYDSDDEICESCHVAPSRKADDCGCAVMTEGSYGVQN